MNEGKFKKSLKIITRLCKEANIFPGSFYKNIIDFVYENNSYVFYGKDGMAYSRQGVNFEAKLYKLQLDLIRSLIDNDILEHKDYITVFNDTLTRYNLKAHYDTPRWTQVVVTSNKKEFFKYFVEKYERKIGVLNIERLAYIKDGLPED